MGKGSGAGLAAREQGRARREQRGSNEGATREHNGALQGHSRWEPNMASSYPAIAAHVIYNNILSPG